MRTMLCNYNRITEHFQHKKMIHYSLGREYLETVDLVG